MASQDAALNPPSGSVLRGEKTILRPFEESDITERYLGWLNDPEVVRYSNQRFVAHDRESSVRYLRSFAGTANLFISVLSLDTQYAIGTMTAYVAIHHGTADVGILIGDKSVWGRGFGQDAWNTLTDWLIGKESIRKVTAGTVACNAGMLKIMARSGMTLEGARKAQEIIEGRPEDVMYFAKWHA